MTSENGSRLTFENLKENATGFNQSKMLEREHVSWDTNSQLVVCEKKWKTDPESPVREETILLISKTESQVENEMASNLTESQVEDEIASSLTESQVEDETASSQTRMDNSCSSFDELDRNQLIDETATPQSDLQVCKVGRSCSKIFTCNRCSYETDRKNNLKRHIATMHDPAPAALDCCGTRFATKGDLRDHTRSAHGAGYTCWQCGHTFCRRALLHRHQSVHSGLKAFSCSKCGYQSSHKSNMQRHMQVHLQSRGIVGSGGVAGRSKERTRNSVKLSFAKVLSNSARSGCSVSPDGNAFKNLEFIPSHLDDFPKTTNHSFYPPIGERITPPSLNVVNHNSVIFPCNILSKATTSSVDGLHYLGSSTSNSFSDKRFSRALTTIKSIHLSQKRINSKHRMSVNSIRPLSNSCDMITSQRNQVKILNPDVWRLAFLSQNETHASYQHDMEMLRQEIQSNERNIPTTKADPLNFSKNQFFHQTASATDIFPASYFISQSRVSQQPANTLDANADVLFMNNSRLESSLSRSKISNHPTFLPRTAFHSDFTDPPMMDSLQSRLGSESSDEYEKAVPTSRQGRCGRRLLHRPIPTYPRTVTDFSVNSLLAKGVMGSSSPETSEGPIVAEHCQGVTQTSAIAEEVIPRDTSSSLLWARLQTSDHLQRSEHRTSAFEQRLKDPSPPHLPSFESRDCIGRVSDISPPHPPSSESRDYAARVSDVVDFSSPKYTLLVHRISPLNNLGNPYHRPGVMSEMSCDETPSPSCIRSSSPRLFLKRSSSRDQRCFKETNASLSKTVGINQKLCTSSPVPQTHTHFPRSDSNVPLDCSLPKSNNRVGNHPDQTEVHYIDHQERNHHTNFSPEVSRRPYNADLKSTQAVTRVPNEVATVGSKRLISRTVTNIDLEETGAMAAIVPGCALHGGEEKWSGFTGKPNVLAIQEPPTANVKSQPEQYIPKKIRALNRTWRQVKD